MAGPVERLEPHDPGVVDENVEVGVLGEETCRPLGHGGRVLDVQGHGVHARPPLDRPVEGLPVRERGKLAHPTMTEPLTGPADQHLRAVQEGAVGGGAAAESGCGCN